MSIIDLKHDIKRKLVEVYGLKCYYCDKNFFYSDLTLDHIYPTHKRKNRRKGRLPKYSFNQLILACRPCNLRKGCRVVSIEEFRKETMGDTYYPYDIDMPLTKRKPYFTKIGLKKEKKEKKNKLPNIVFSGYKDIKYPDNPLVRVVTAKSYPQRLLDFLKAKFII